jgi:tetratricopeptide (TPR) repeat protein
VLRFGEQVRVEVKLIDARQDALLWSGQYERPAAELDALQRDVAAAVAVQLRTRQGEVQVARAPDAEAHLLTMRARYWLNEKRDRKVAVQLLRRAITKDPTYAEPHAVLAEAETFLPEPDLSPYESLVRAKASAEKAVALDPLSADAHAALGTVLMFLDRDFAAAEREYRRAIELKPGASETHHRYGQLLAAQGRFEEALAEGKRSVELDPFSTLAIDDYGRTLYFARRYSEAMLQYDRALAIEPGDTIAFWFRIYALIAAKENDRVVEELAQLMTRSERGWYVPQLRELYARGGIDAVIREWAALDAQQARDARFIRSSGVATRYAQAGETELAIQWLERAYASHTRDLVYLNVEPQFDNLREDPRFKEIAGRVFGPGRQDK